MIRVPSLSLALVAGMTTIASAAPPTPTTKPAAPATAAAPAANTTSLSIADAMRLALGHSFGIEAARQDVKRAHGGVIQARSALFPSVFGSASYDRTLESEFEGLFDTGPSPVPAGMEVDLPFGQPNTYRVGLAATYDLFNGGRSFAQIDLAKAGESQAKLGLVNARALTVLQTAQQYYDTELSQRLVEISQSTLEQAESTLEQARVAFKQGAVPEFELLRATVTRDNQVQDVVRRRTQRDLAVLALKQLLGLPFHLPVALTSQPEGTQPQGTRSDALARELVGLPAESPTRSAVKQAELVVTQRAAQLRAARSEWWPHINLFSNLGWVQYPDSLPAFDDWRTNWTVGAQLTVPIFTGGRIFGSVRQAQSSETESRVRLQQVRELSALDDANARQELTQAEAALRASAGTVEQAERAYEIGKLRYAKGVSTQLELVDARLLLEQARANRALAARDVEVARVRLAILPALPLSEIGQSSTSAAPASTGAARATVTASPAPQGSLAGTGTGSTAASSAGSF